MTSYYSALFFTAFLPITVMLYGMAPRRFRWAVLLLASYGFFFALSGALIAFVALSTAVVYACARMMGANLAEKNRQLATASSGKREIREACKRKNRRIVFAAVVANIGILAVLKYSGFFGLSLASTLAAFGISIDLSIPSFALPIGISFYTLMAVSYVVDVSRTNEGRQEPWARGAVPGIFQESWKDRSADTTTLRPALSRANRLIERTCTPEPCALCGACRRRSSSRTG
ncbi:MAG: hypothetical protein ACLT98_11775 [Eggerthellaceae bacterium]